MEIQNTGGKSRNSRIVNLIYERTTSIDLHNMEMNGVFEMTFARDPNDYIDNQSLPDTIRFTNGSFRIKIHY